MSNPYFKFKQFTVWHDRCAMKVGTDGVLLGAWADANQADRILDIGTGTGLIALMLGQRTPETTHITALEIDQDAALQATENISRSPWHDKIDVKCADFNTYTAESAFDLIVSNPPYFIQSLNCPDKQRNTARHNNSLTYETLISRSSSMLTAPGKLALIFPMEVYDTVLAAASASGLYPSEIVRVITAPQMPAKRCLACFTRQNVQCRIQELLIEKSRHVYSDEFTQLVKDFYLKL